MNANYKSSVISCVKNECLILKYYLMSECAAVQRWCLSVSVCVIVVIVVFVLFCHCWIVGALIDGSEPLGNDTKSGQTLHTQQVLTTLTKTS
jgi:hypothetical protein